jgi:DnaK suppressor protein
MPASKKKELLVLIHGVKPYVEKKGEKYMNKKQLEHFRAILMGWKNELLDEVSKTVHSMQDETVNHPDPNDRASQETDMSLELRSRDRERKLIKKIEEATAKIDSGDYGYCETCGIEIGVQRLEARPTAALCIDCKTLDEIREKQMG